MGVLFHSLPQLSFRFLIRSPNPRLAYMQFRYDQRKNSSCKRNKKKIMHIIFKFNYNQFTMNLLSGHSLESLLVR